MCERFCRTFTYIILYKQKIIRVQLEYGGAKRMLNNINVLKSLMTLTRKDLPEGNKTSRSWGEKESSHIKVRHDVGLGNRLVCSKRDGGRQ